MAILGGKPIRSGSVCDTASILPLSLLVSYWGPFAVATNSAEPISMFHGLQRAWVLLIPLACASLTGCVQRRMTIRTNPPGALVYVDDYEIGTTPISHNFTYYGTRKIRLVKDGYETLTVMQPIAAPWYQIPPLDFFSENLVPGEIRDRRTLTYQLRPQMVVPPDQLLGRAESLRGQVQAPRAAAPTMMGPPLSTPAVPGPSMAPPFSCTSGPQRARPLASAKHFWPADVSSPRHRRHAGLSAAGCW